jgi:hypothetical protein
MEVVNARTFKLPANLNEGSSYKHHAVMYTSNCAACDRGTIALKRKVGGNAIKLGFKFSKSGMSSQISLCRNSVMSYS